jgi:hypothetical protein
VLAFSSEIDAWIRSLPVALRVSPESMERNDHGTLENTNILVGPHRVPLRPEAAASHAGKYEDRHGQHSVSIF